MIKLTKKERLVFDAFVKTGKSSDQLVKELRDVGVAMSKRTIDFHFKGLLNKTKEETRITMLVGYYTQRFNVGQS